MVNRIREQLDIGMAYEFKDFITTQMMCMKQTETDNALENMLMNHFNYFEAINYDIGHRYDAQMKFVKYYMDRGISYKNYSPILVDAIVNNIRK